MIINSRGEPTVEVGLTTDLDDRVYLASAPSGASRGEHEAWELRDRGIEFRGMGVKRAIAHINEIIAPAMRGYDVLSQARIDDDLIDLDGHINKSRLGANAVLPVSLAVCRAGAAGQEKFLWAHLNNIYRSLNEEASPSLPKPCFNVINGGLHAGNWLDFQEFMIVPQSDDISENIRAGVEFYGELKRVIIEQIGSGSANIGDEGGFAPALVIADSALDLILTADRQRSPGPKIKIGLDCAANSFFNQGHYRLADSAKGTDQMIDYYQELIGRYPIIFLEDPLIENDWLGWSSLVRKTQGRIDIIGDDLTVTNIERIQEAKKNESANGLVVKPNQIGTVTESLKAAALASSFGWRLMVAHRSGDTNDDFIADLAVGLGADYFKSGAPARGERVAKYNRLLAIQTEMKNA